jgi:anaerobic ribonucleoside-triphosphate reductase activating protein
MRIAGIIKDSLIDGPGVRLVVFFQGCEFNCPHCQNPETHDPDGGYVSSIEEILSHVTEITTGLTISGGEPTLQMFAAVELAKEAQKRGLNVMIYTGKTREEWGMSDMMYEITPLFDYIKFGRYVHELRDTSLPYRGSSNQEIYQLQADRTMSKLC